MTTQQRLHAINTLRRASGLPLPAPAPARPPKRTLQPGDRVAWWCTHQQQLQAGTILTLDADRAEVENEPTAQHPARTTTIIHPCRLVPAHATTRPAATVTDPAALELIDAAVRVLTEAAASTDLDLAALRTPDKAAR